MKNIERFLITKLDIPSEFVKYYLSLYEILIEESSKFPNDRLYTLRQLLPPQIWCEAVGDDACQFGSITKAVSIEGLLPIEYVTTNSANHALYEIKQEE